MREIIRRALEENDKKDPATLQERINREAARDARLDKAASSHASISVTPLSFEPHFRVSEIAKMWGLSREVVTGLFRYEPGVFSIDNHGTGKRLHTTLSIPASVVERVHERRTRPKPPPFTKDNNPFRLLRLQNLRPKGLPVKVVRARDLDRTKV